MLRWYDTHRRAMPWRALAGAAPNPYHVWLSEIMLQQTTVTAVQPYFLHFIRLWPDIGALADASLDQVLHGWQGLGYYARARNLHKCAQVIAGECDGRFPESAPELLKLPGVGPYTAAAIAAIAFGQSATPVDGNIERVMARLFMVEAPLPEAKAEIKRLAEIQTPPARPGDYAQALMDLGATVCTPGKPHCARCPLAKSCAAGAAGNAEDYPHRAPKKPKPTRRGWVYWLVDAKGRVALRRRPEKGLLGGLMEFPSSEWAKARVGANDAAENAPFAGRWKPVPGTVKHTFTHFHLELRILEGAVQGGGKLPEILWCAPDEFSSHALPSVMKKVAAHALGRNLP